MTTGSWHDHALQVRSNARLLFVAVLTAAIAQVCSAGEEHWPGTNWIEATPAEAGMDQTNLEAARHYALSAGGSGCITRHGRLVMAWGDFSLRYDHKSSTKSFRSVALGLALKDEWVRLGDRAQKFHPALGTPLDANTNTGWLAEVTLLHLASQTAGFEKPGGFTRQLFRPGTMWDYSDSGPN